MAASITARALYDAQHVRLSLKWLAGQPGEQHLVRSLDLAGNGGAQGPPLFVGHLNVIHPYQIQVLGDKELAYLNGLRKNSRNDTIARLFDGKTAVVIVTGVDPVPVDVVQAAEASGTPLFSSPLESKALVNHLHYYLASALATHFTVHGVFMEVAGIGVLLTGDSGIGKSELALELISRGHRLIADDATELHRISPETLNGACPEPLRNFLEVRGLGVLNIRAMYGDSAIKHNEKLRLIVHLVVMDDEQLRNIDRLHGSRQNRVILGVEIPQVTLPVVPGLNLAVLVECAVRNHILYQQGYNAGLDFIERQQHYITQNNA